MLLREPGSLGNDHVAQPPAITSIDPTPRANSSIDFTRREPVLVADEFDDLIVGRDLLIDANGEWLRIGLRVLEGDIDFELAVRGPECAR